ncbi:MAG: hypothetical protein P8M67_04610, partial [Opitutales bacterium]|nr:hypothetical protein [Opitutales bacterium]
VGVASLQGRWAFDGENANDSSGAGRHGTAKKLFSPSEVSSMKLWLDASELTTVGSTWYDKSENSNDAVKNGSPSIVLGSQNGKNIMRYSGTTGEFHSWTQMTDIRTVFWVLKKTGSNPNMLLLGDASTYSFHPNGINAMYHPSLGPVANVRGGTTKINGTSANGTSTGIPTSMSVISLKTSGIATASNFANDRNIVQSGVNRVFEGDLGELLIFNTALSDADIEKIEGYLAHKWGLEGELPNDHGWKSTPPSSVVSFNTSAIPVTPQKFRTPQKYITYSYELPEENHYEEGTYLAIEMDNGGTNGEKCYEGNINQAIFISVLIENKI